MDEINTPDFMAHFVLEIRWRLRIGDAKLSSNFYYIMAGHAIVVVKDINLLFYHGNAVILTFW